VAESSRSYIPAAGRDWLLPFYDPLQWLLGAHKRRRAVLEAAALQTGHRVLDVGCGTGSLVAGLKAERPDVAVTGLDPDPRALGRARRKLERAGLEVRLDEGFADAMPYPDASFERVLSSFMFHHLEHAAKKGMLREVLRVLAPGGELHLLDFGGQATHHHGFFAKRIHSHDELADNFDGRIGALMREAGFENVREVSHGRTIFGGVAHYAGGRPSS